MTNNLHPPAPDFPDGSEGQERYDEEADEPEEDEDEMDDDEEAEFPDDLYGLKKSDRDGVEALGSMLRSILSRSDLTNQEIYDTVRMIRAVELLPRCIDDVEAQLTLTEQLGGGSTRALYIRIDGQAIELMEVYWHVSPLGIGSDTESTLCFRAEPGGYREAARVDAIEDWAIGATRMIADGTNELRISAWGIDLNDTEEIDEENWERLPR